MAGYLSYKEEGLASNPKLLSYVSFDWLTLLVKFFYKNIASQVYRRRLLTCYKYLTLSVFYCVFFFLICKKLEALFLVKAERDRLMLETKSKPSHYCGREEPRRPL